MVKKIINPDSNRKITVGGTVYKKLVEEGKLQKHSAGRPSRKSSRSPRKSSRSPRKSSRSPRKSSRSPRKSSRKSPRSPRKLTSKGWKQASPQRGTPRKKLLEECGKKCFLIPDKKKFPICKKCSRGKCDCKPDCRAILSAKRRAHQQERYPELYAKIDRLLEKCRKREL
jgi:hypothetical protein